MNKEEEDGISIHRDLVIEIFSRIPVKMLVRLQCLSKEFSKMLQTRDFVDACLSRSSNRSRLLFYFQCYGNPLVFFSAPHCLCEISSLLYVTLPRDSSLAYSILGKSYDLKEFVIFRYDPIFDQFKVLCISGPQNQYQFWVLTVGKYGNLWRKIQGMPNHLHPSKLCGQCGICINGILYFQADCHTPGYGMTSTHVVSFDLNSEKFSLVKANSHLSWFSKLVDFQGKLGFISRVKDCEVEFSCLMKDNEWSSEIFHVPGARVPDYREISSSVLGICEGEIVFAPPSYKDGYTWHLSLESKTTRKVHFETPSKDESYASDVVFFFANHADTHVSLL